MSKGTNWILDPVRAVGHVGPPVGELDRPRVAWRAERGEEGAELGGVAHVVQLGVGGDGRLLTRDRGQAESGAVDRHVLPPELLAHVGAEERRGGRVRQAEGVVAARVHRVGHPSAHRQAAERLRIGRGGAPHHLELAGVQAQRVQPVAGERVEVLAPHHQVGHLLAQAGPAEHEPRGQVHRHDLARGEPAVSHVRGGAHAAGQPTQDHGAERGADPGLGGDPQVHQVQPARPRGHRRPPAGAGHPADLARDHDARHDHGLHGGEHVQAGQRARVSGEQEVARRAHVDGLAGELDRGHDPGAGRDPVQRVTPLRHLRTVECVVAVGVWI